ncbi:hypothetical protein [Mesorhizobium sp. M7A.T.Ca.TU.009.02.1.1]|nr:hypothetical protein [Mesorhizobium sp. M7A.T.Ca.TU.009.02.1.1]
MIMLRLLASASPRLSFGPAGRDMPLALPVDTLKGAIRLRFAAWRLSLLRSRSTIMDIMTARSRELRQGAWHVLADRHNDVGGHRGQLLDFRAAPAAEKERDMSRFQALLVAARRRVRPIVIWIGMPLDQAVHCQRVHNSRERSRP